MKDESEHVRLNEKKWDRWADSLDNPSPRRNFLRNAQSKVISLLNVQEEIHFLDIGCGTGWAVGEVAKLTEDKGLFYGVDLSPKMIEKAKRNFSGQDNFRFLQANVESIPLNDDFFDIIICTNSFHHYLNPGQALNEMYRLLKSGGKVYILDPTSDLWILKLTDKAVKWFEPEHVKMYSTEEFQELFSKAGLKYIDTARANWHEKIHVGEK